VEDAQATIANMAKELAASGEIDISTGSDDRMIE
jgi:flagellar motor switch protein FliG